MTDAVASAVVVPAYLSGNLLLQVSVAIGLILASVWSFRLLARTGVEAEPGDGNMV